MYVEPVRPDDVVALKRKRWFVVRAIVAIALLSATACSRTNDQSAPESQSSSVSASDSLLSGVTREEFVEGNLRFIAFHEAGHALISEFEIPVLGREEDAVDRLAAWLMTPEEANEDAIPLIAAMAGWFLIADESGMDEIAWWGAHGTDQQRGYQIACLLYGMYPETQTEIADSAGLPEERRPECEEEASQNEESWLTLMEPHQREEGESGEVGSVETVFEPTEEYSEERKLLEEMGLLEDIAELLRDGFRIEPGVRVIGNECDEPNAYWDPEAREVTICYELVSDITDRAQSVIAE